LTVVVACALKLLAMPTAAFVLALAAGVVVLFAGMPTGANVYIFRLSTSGFESGVGGGGVGRCWLR